MKILPAIALPLLLCGYCHAATTLIGGSIQNGNFESSGTGTVLFSTNTITNWTNWAEIDTATNNTGVYSPGGGAPRNDRGAFIQPGGAIRNMTTYTAQVGDTFSSASTLSSWAVVRLRCSWSTMKAGSSRASL